MAYVTRHYDGRQHGRYNGRRCGKRRAKINESLYYKMPKCGAQSMYVLAVREGAGHSSSSNTNNKIAEKKKSRPMAAIDVIVAIVVARRHKVAHIR